MRCPLCEGLGEMPAGETLRLVELLAKKLDPSARWYQKLPDGDVVEIRILSAEEASSLGLMTSVK